MPLSKKELELEIADTGDILKAWEAESEAFNAKVAALLPGPPVEDPGANAVLVGLEPADDHFLEAGHFGAAPEDREKDDSDEPFETTCLANVRISPVDWLWQGRIARGMITLVEGDPGVGKSTLVADIVARHTTGAPFPGESGAGRTPEKALWLTLEDSLEHTLKPRIVAANGDPGMIEARLGVPILAKAGAPDQKSISKLRKTVQSTGATLMVIDPGAATVEDANSEAIVRQAMGELFKMGQLDGVTVIWIRHLVKAREGKTALMAGGGSIGLAAAARSILQVVVDRGRKEAGNHLDRCVINPKNNLGKEAAPFYFGLTDTEVTEDFCTVHVARAEWAYSEEEGVDHYDILASIARAAQESGPKARKEWEDVVFKEFEARGWELTPTQVSAALSQAGLKAKSFNQIGSSGNAFRKTYGIEYDTARCVYELTKPDAGA